MTKSAICVALVTTLAIAGCGPKPKPAPPAPPPAAPAPPPPAPPPARAPEVAPVQDEYSKIKAMSTDEIDRMGLLAEIHFDFDKYDVREADRAILAKNADVLKKFDFLRVTIEGHCDDRGTNEYNLALGEARARSAKAFLVDLGVPAARMATISYGEERPAARGAAEDAWAKNRRAHFVIEQ